MQVTLRIPVDHPCAEGHFPDNPIVPAAVLLDEILGAIEHAQGRAPQAWTVTGAKFLHPVRPGDILQVTLVATAGGELRFECSVGERSVLTGRAHPTPGGPG